MLTDTRVENITVVKSGRDEYMNDSFEKWGERNGWIFVNCFTLAKQDCTTLVTCASNHRFDSKMTPRLRASSHTLCPTSRQLAQFVRSWFLVPKVVGSRPNKGDEYDTSKVSLRNKCIKF